MRDLYIFDLDGTLADCTHRLHLIEPPADKFKGWKRDWPAFFEACDKDTPVEWVIHLNHLIFKGMRPNAVGIILSGRMATVRTQTEAWLEKHDVLYGELLMRAANDFRCDTTVKLEMLNTFLERNPDCRVRFIVDDRQKVVDMWRANGYPVLQCAAWVEKQGTYEK